MSEKDTLGFHAKAEMMSVVVAALSTDGSLRRNLGIQVDKLRRMAGEFDKNSL